MEYTQYIGQKIAKWTIVSHILKGNRNHFLVKCECGTTSTPTAYHVIKGFSSSCKFCAPKKHGQSHTPTYRSWNGARNRCNNPRNKDFHNYGDRGITMSNRWNDYANFLVDMGEKPMGLTLDRIDNNGNYEPGNCRWATMSTQNSNQRKRISKVKN